MVVDNQEREKEFNELIRRQIELQKDIEEFLKRWKIPKVELLAKK